MPPVVSHFVCLQPRAWARVYVNDVPVYRAPHIGPDSRSGPLNHLLRQGENEVTVELLRAGKQPGYDRVPDAFVFELYIVNNLDAPATEKLDRTLLCDVRYPKIFEDARPEFQREPLHHRQTFRIEEPLPTPLYFHAEPASFGCEGTPDLRDAVQRIHGALERGDHEGFLDELSLRFECDERAYPDEDGMRAGPRMQKWRDELFPYDPRPDAPLDLSQLHFEARCGGRVAHVTRHDERHVLDVACRKDPKRRIRTDLLLIQHGGRWRVFA